MTQESIRISALTEETTIADDMEFVLDDPSDTAASKKATALTMQHYFAGSTPPTPGIASTIWMWGQADTTPPTAIPSDAVSTTGLMLSITLSADAYIVFAQLAAQPDFTSVMAAGSEVLPIFTKGAATFDDADGDAIEYWIINLEQRSGASFTYMFTR